MGSGRVTLPRGLEVVVGASTSTNPIDVSDSTPSTPTVMVRGHGLILSIVHLPPLTDDSPFTFTVLLIFFTDSFQYIIW